LEFATIGSRFISVGDGGELIRGVPPGLPHFALPWFPIPLSGEGALAPSFHFLALIPSALAITLLGSVESLLSAVIADDLSGTKHDPNSELTALGIGNIICPFFGGIAATGAIARTATNIRFGARSPISSAVHALFTLVVVALFAPIVSWVPMASLAGLLIYVAYNMSDPHEIFRFLRSETRSEIFVFFACFIFCRSISSMTSCISPSTSARARAEAHFLGQHLCASRRERESKASRLPLPAIFS